MTLILILLSQLYFCCLNRIIPSLPDLCGISHPYYSLMSVSLYQKTKQDYGVAQALVYVCLAIPLTCYCGTWHRFPWVNQRSSRYCLGMAGISTGQ